MRILALTPAGIEIVRALGLGDELVGPAEGSPSAEEALADVRPDLVLAPPLEPAARRRLDEAARAAGPDVNVLALDPTTVEGVFNAIVSVGALASAEDAALELVEALRQRLGAIEERVHERRSAGVAPVRVVALEWLDPPAAVGLWVPEQVRRAGGWEVLGSEGAPSRPTSWDAVRDVDPATILLMPRGLRLAAAVRAWEELPRPPGWTSFEAVRRGQVFVVDAASHFSHPGPGIIEGIELLAELFDPDGFVDAAPPGAWTPVA